MSNPTQTHAPAAAAPLLWNRPRLRFVEGAPDGAAPSDPKPEGSEPTGGDDPKPEPKPQEGKPADGEEFDADRAKAKIREVNQEAKNLRERTKAAEQAAEESKGAAERVPALEAENMRLKIAVKFGLPENVAKRLTGSTEEELLADAEDLLEMFGTKGSKPPPTGQPREQLRGGGDPTQPSTDPTLDSGKFAESVFN